MTFEEKLAEIQRLLAEAYEHYFKYSDGLCKSSEGAIRVHVPAFFWDKESWEPSIEVWSYALGPSRAHYFKNVDEALAAVTEWHRKEMATEYDEHGDPVGGGWF